MEEGIEKALNELEFILNKFKKVGSRFDFARYSFDNNGNYLFYRFILRQDYSIGKRVKWGEFFWTIIQIL